MNRFIHWVIFHKVHPHREVLDAVADFKATHKDLLSKIEKMEQARSEVPRVR